MSTDLSELSMLELFRIEVANQAPALTAGLLALEREPGAAAQLEACMRAAHSLKGAANIVGVGAAVGVAHAMEDCFVAAQAGRLRLQQAQIDPLLGGVDLLSRLARTGGTDPADALAVHAFVEALRSSMLSPQGDALAGMLAAAPVERALPLVALADGAERVLRVSADNLNRLLGLAAESLVASRWLRPFADTLLRLKRLQHAAQQGLDGDIDARQTGRQQLQDCEPLLAQALLELETFDRRSADLSRRLYNEAVACRMRPFSDALQATPRMLRDLGRALGKQLRLEIVGAATPVDRDVLESLDAPLGHLLRNAAGHGIESPEQRQAAGKPAEGLLRLEARHSAGALQISLSDDGRGIDLEALRRRVVERHLSEAELAAKLSEAELLEFLFLPGFSLSEQLTDISGRGVGLDVVQNMVRQLRGTVRISTQAGQGTRFLLQLPLTLSVVRTLLVDIGGEPYAFPLAHIVRTLKLAPQQIALLEGRQHIELDGRRIGLVGAHQILQTGVAPASSPALSIIVIGDQVERYGLVVDRFLGERELVVQALDPRLGKLKDISAGALMEDGSPVLIVDTEDLLRSVHKLIAGGQISQVQPAGSAAAGKRRKRVLVVDDSLTVRELERKLLAQHGYEVEVAVDGMDGWNAVRSGHFDLLVTDIDMPRMDGIELLRLVKQDARLKSLPVMIMSYKDRAEDRQRGLEAGADHYLTKGSFHDETLLQAAVDLIGEAQ